MMRIRAVQFVFAGYLVFFALFAWAGPASAQQDSESDAETFVPTSAWLVGPASVEPVSGTGLAMPCVMMTQYNNGFIFRFSVGEGKIPAMAVDSHREAFRPGDSFDVTIGIDPAFSSTFSAESYSGSTFLISLQQTPGFYEALRGGKILTLTIGDSPFRFALLGIQDGLARAGQCGGATVLAGEKQSLAAKIYEDVVQPPPPAETDDSAGAESEAVTPGGGGAVAALDGMLDNAAQKLAALAPAAGRPYGMHSPEMEPAKPPVPDGVALARTWLPPADEAKGGEPVPASRDIIEATVPEAAPAQEGGQRRWRAMKGMNLHEVLDSWSMNANVRLIWKTEREFAVDESVVLQGTFEDAVLSLLEQYGRDRVRPVGRMYVEPALHQKVLLIELGK